MLSSLPELDLLRDTAASDDAITRVGNVDVMASTDGDVAICHLVYFMPFSRVGQNGERKAFNELNTFESGAAVVLAAQHLNVGDGSLVPELAGMPKRCPIRFTVEMIDTEFVERAALNAAISLTERNSPDRSPCAIIGALRSAVSIPTSIVSSLRGYPQVSGMSTSSALDDKSLHPLFGRTIPSDDGTAVAAVLYLRNVLGVRHLGMFYTSDSYGTAFARGMHDAVSEHAPDLIIDTFQMRFEASQEEVETTVALLKETQNMFFFGAVFDFDAEAVMAEAVKQGIAGTGSHNWFFSDGVGSIDKRNYTRDSPLGQAYRGTAVIKAAGVSNSRLAGALSELANKEDLAYLQSVLPTYPDDNGTSLLTPLLDSSFLSMPILWEAFLYDAAIALGVAACDAASKTNGDYFDGETLYDTMVKNRPFNGTSGKVIFDPSTGTREVSSVAFDVVNFVEDEQTVPGKMFTLKAVQTDIFQNGEWHNLQPFIFNDGTSKTPSDLPEVTVNTNYLPTGLRAVGFALCGIILLLSVGFSVWTHCNRRERVVRASQPIFLHIISFGTFIMGSSIIPLSIDRGIASDQGSNIACMSFPWLICIGFSATFSALFTKTHRINKIFGAGQFRRVKVTPLDVAKPMIVVLGANVIVLTLFSVLDPLEVQTSALARDPFSRPIETYDFCDSEGKLPFLVCLGVINIGSLMYATYEAYRANNVPTEFAESRDIFRATAFILNVCFIGIPVLFIARENPSAFFFVWAGIIFVTCTCTLLFIFVPKIRIHYGKANADQPLSTMCAKCASSGVGAIGSRAVVREQLEEEAKISEEIEMLKKKDCVGVSEIDKKMVASATLTDSAGACEAGLSTP